MPLTLVAVLVLISWQVAVDGPLLALDTGTRNAVREIRHHLHNTLLNHAGAALSDLGGTVPAIPTLLAAAVLSAAGRRTRRTDEHDGQDSGNTGIRSRWWFPLPTAAAAAVLIPLLVVPAKAWFARPGPYGLPLAADQWGWYPSGHTVTSAVAYGTAAVLLAGRLGAVAARRLYAATAALCAGVGGGLVWSDYHWLLDVLAGWCLAGTVLWAVARLLRPKAARAGSPS